MLPEKRTWKLDDIARFFELIWYVFSRENQKGSWWWPPEDLQEAFNVGFVWQIFNVVHEQCYTVRRHHYLIINSKSRPRPVRRQAVPPQGKSCSKQLETDSQDLHLFLPKHALWEQKPGSGNQWMTERNQTGWEIHRRKDGFWRRQLRGRDSFIHTIHI